MNNTINGRTPAELKGLLANRRSFTINTEGIFDDALAYIQQLERERDAAVADLKEHGMFCSLCMHEEKSIHEEPCVSCSKLSTANNHSNWQWRGVQQEVE